jgi:transposase
MGQLLRYAVGVDVGESKLVCCFSQIDSQQNVQVRATRSFDNRPGGFGELALWVAKHQKERDIPLSVVMEATGIYYEAAAMYLHKKKYRICVVLPNKSRRYMQSLGLKSKNDRIDAKGLAQMGAEQQLAAWQPGNPTLYELKTLTRHHERLQQMRAELVNQLHAHRRMASPSKAVASQLVGLVKTLDKQMLKTVAAIKKCLDKEPEVKAKIDLIAEVKGFGLLSACVLVAETNGFELFKSARQLTSYAGYDVVENQSGKHVGKTKISKQGNGHIRRILFMPAFNVVRLGVAPFAGTYQRIYDKTGVKMKAYVAIQRKLLVLTYTLYKKGVAFEVPENKSEKAAA